MILAAFTAVGTSAWAYWTAAGSGAGQATNGTLNPPNNLDTSAAPGSSTVNLTWDGSSLSTGTGAQGYHVTRTKESDSSTTDACGTTAAALTTATTCTDSAVPDGTFHYTVTAVYNSWTAVGQSGTSITIDTTAPAVPTAPTMTAGSDSGSSSTDGITNVGVPTFAGTAEDGSTVTLFDGATPVGTSVATGGAYSVMSSILPEGAKTMTVTATDVAGNVGLASPSTIVIIDTTAPAAPAAPTLTTASDSGSSSSDGITNIRTPTFTGTAEDESTAKLYNGSTLVGTADATGGAYSVTSTTLSGGAKTMTVTATDVAGNVGLASPSTSITIDFAAPTAGQPALTAASDTGKSSNDRNTSDTTPTFTGTGGAGATVTLYEGAIPLGTDAAPYTITSSTLTDGTHSITAQATDVAGNVGTASTARIVTIDTIAPLAPSTPALTLASDTGISSTDGITKDTTPTLTGTAEDGVTVTLYGGVSPIGGAVTATVTATGGVYTATTGTLAQGSQTLTAEPTDVAGNVGPSSTGISVMIDTTRPTVTMNQAAGQVDPTTATTINFTAVFSESVYGLDGTGVTHTGTAAATTATVTGTGTTFNVAVSWMSKNGTVISTVPANRAQDAAGNNNLASTFTDKTVTYTDTAPPTVAISSFVPGALQSATASGTAGFGPGDDLMVTVVFCTTNVFPCLAGNIRATLTPSVSATTGAWSATSGTLGTNSTLYAKANQVDLAGNSGESLVVGPIAIL